MTEDSIPNSVAQPLLQIQDLRTYFYSQESVAKAVDGVSYQVGKRQTLGIVGESGSGKSITALSVMKLIPQPPGKIVSGQILLNGRDLVKLSERQMRKVRGNQISMIFQEPMTSLNPVFTIGDQIGEVFRIHKGMKKKQSIQEAVRMLELVKISAASQRVHDYPHQLSGGMRQRVMIAMALACNPDLLIADEPTTALDVTVQAQILDLMGDLKETYGSSILMITHDLGVIAEISDQVAVMYAGQAVEHTATDKLFEKPMHPYTMGLLDSRPRMIEGEKNRLRPIMGMVPNPSHHPTGCRFHPRCPYATSDCQIKEPEAREITPGHMVRCHFAEEILEGTQPRHKVKEAILG
ncbi:MAG: ABC transporter ATP-binding protein [Candidatus Sumerlaeia bacterium]|nr:ABC transporter ATP-binding protein [Candidatus Sumerlaeia bacterium]